MIDGILNILKPSGMTSHDVVSFVRRTLKTKKVGHAGTLDPDAAGILPIFVGRATRLIEYTADADKVYRVHMRFGSKTDSGDDSGQVIETSDVYRPTLDELQLVFSRFTGPIMQIPPMYSALKHNGQKLYQLARQGIEVKRQARSITIGYIKLIEQYDDGLHLEVSCSKGTYIRTLIEDLAQALGMCATMTFLLRTQVGMFNLQSSIVLEALSDNPTEHLKSFLTAIQHLPQLTLTANQSLRFTQGVLTTVNAAIDACDSVAVYSDSQEFLGIGSFIDGKLKPQKVFFDFR